MNRRQWFAGIVGATMGAHLPLRAQKGVPLKDVDNSKPPLLLADFKPKSMLHVVESDVEKPSFPVVDFHTHLCWSDVLDGNQKLDELSTPDKVLPVMDRRGVRVMVSLTGGYGAALPKALNYWHKPHPDRFVIFVEPWYARTDEPGYASFQADELVKAKKAGAQGLKVLKTLGLFLREHIKKGKLVKVDDPRFDPMWETAGALGMPVLIHTSDPEALFLKPDADNERYEELTHHPDWSFYGPGYPSNMELQAARNRVVARHPKTTFVMAHVGDAENLEYISECFDKYPNLYADISARIGELGRQPKNAKRFFEKYQDRLLFGTDAVPPPAGNDVPQQLFCDDLYKIYYRFLETEDEYFDYAPAETPPQGRWRIYGLGLQTSILRKVYHENAERLLNQKLV